MNHQKTIEDTDKIEASNCIFHSGICANVKRSAQDIQALWAAHDKMLNDFNEKYITMYRMFLCAVGAFVLMCLTWAINNFHIFQAVAK